MKKWKILRGVEQEVHRLQQTEILKYHGQDGYSHCIPQYPYLR